MRLRKPAALSAVLAGATVLTLLGSPADAAVRVPHADRGARATTVADPAPASGGDVSVQETPLMVVPAAEADPSGGGAPAPGDAVEPDPGTALEADAITAAGRVETAAVDTAGVQTIGVTWPAGAVAGALEPSVRTQTDGRWSAWVPLDDSDVAPDPGTADESHMRDGTDSYWIGDADAIQLSFAATVEGGPADMSLTLVGSDATPATASAGTATARTESGAVVRQAVSRTASSTVTVAEAAATSLSTAAAAPRVITRAEWGARPQVCAPDVASTLVGAVVHHTAGSNAYASVAEAMQQIRNDQAYHIDGRGWCDIGYNFIVDKWGNIYEGRANSLTQPVIGVHAGGFNTGTVGVSMLGDYSSVTPSAATQEAVAQIIGYRLGRYGRDPAGSMSYYTLGGENSRYAAGTTVGLPVVFGHRDTAYTACPGNLGYSTLPGIRARAHAAAYAEPLVRSLYRDLLERDPDPSGLQGWTAALAAGTAASVLGDRIAHSQEYVQRKVVEAYAEILRRGPDPTGLASWTQVIMAGALRVEDLRGTLIGSDEYVARFGGGTPGGYIQALYSDILERQATPAEVSTWTAAIAARGWGVAPAGVWRSGESARLRVDEAYATFLDRNADPTGLATWIPYWQARGEDALRAQLIGSGEYLARAVRLYS